MKSINVFCFSILLSVSYVSSADTVTPILVEPIQIEPIKVELVCPQSSAHAGEKVPEWVTNEEAIEYFCNSSEEEVAEPDADAADSGGEEPEVAEESEVTE